MTGIAPFAGGVAFTVTHDGSAELWRSDGTVAGTTKLFDLVQTDGNAHDLAAVGSSLYFLGTTGGLGGRDQLFRSDGTSSGTTQLTTFESFGFDRPPNFVSAGTTLYFTAGERLMATDGTAAGTKEVLTPEGNNLSGVYGYAAFGNRLVTLASFTRARQGCGSSTVPVSESG